MTVVGVFVERHSLADYLWNQTDGPFGHHGSIQIAPNRRDADLVLMIGSPIHVGFDRPRRRSGVARVLRRRERERDKLELAWGGFNVPRDRVWTLFFEPPSYVSDEAFDAAKRHSARVYAPDRRATHPLRLPTLWSDQVPLGLLRGEMAPTREGGERGAEVICVTSGKRVLPGHTERMAFLARLRQEGVPLRLFGRGIPSEFGGEGEVQGKAIVTRGSRFALVIENYADGHQYVSEKLWDALVGWSLPLYFGSAAADSMVPPDAIIRLPDLGDRGVDAVRRAVADPDLPWSRMGAIEAARRRVLGEHRIVEWLRRELEAAR